MREGLAAGGAVTMWERVLTDALPEMRRVSPAGCSVLELGYGDGLLSCYLCRELGWRIVGFDIDPRARAYAGENAGKYGLDGRMELHCCATDEIRQHRGKYDAVFIKTVLYNSRTLGEYGRWLDWILSVLKPGGVLVNFETGRANRFMQAYRRLRKRSYTDLSLYTSAVEALYDERFKILYRRYYGGWSQFLSPLRRIYRLGYAIEEAVRPGNADNCFIVGVIAEKGDPPKALRDDRAADRGRGDVCACS